MTDKVSEFVSQKLGIMVAVVTLTVFLLSASYKFYSKADAVQLVRLEKKVVLVEKNVLGMKIKGTYSRDKIKELQDGLREIRKTLRRMRTHRRPKR